MCSATNKRPDVSAISLEESMRLSLVYFEGALISVAKSPVDAYSDFGGVLGSSWEAVQELISGKPLVEWSALLWRQRVLIREIVCMAEGLPGSAFKGLGLDDFNDPAWDEVRKLAEEYFDFIEQHSGAG